MSSTRKIWADLFCGHAVRTAEKDGGVWPQEYCDRCSQWVDVQTYYPEQWHTRCQDCRSRSHHGAVRAYAERSARRHEVRTGHTVSVLWYATTPTGIEDRDATRALYTQPELTLDEPPF